MKQKMLDLFEKVFGDTKDVGVYFAPGRVNLIGEHTDIMAGMYFHAHLPSVHMQQQEREMMES